MIEIRHSKPVSAPEARALGVQNAVNVIQQFPKLSSYNLRVRYIIKNSPVYFRFFATIVHYLCVLLRTYLVKGMDTYISLVSEVIH